MNKIAVWIKASRIPSQLYIFLPLLLGQAIAFRYNYEFSFFVWVLIHIFGIFNQLYIVYANDYADYEIDKLNDTYNIFSGGSRVLVDGNLNKSQLKKGIYFVVSMNFLVIGLIMLYTKNYMLLPMLIIALLLLWAYSYGPIKLSYRGGGEILQAIGVGTLLPMISFYSQTGNVYMFPFVFFIVYFPIQLACALSTTLPDWPSDKIGHKKTLSVLIGYEKVKKIIVVLNLTTFGLFSIFNPFNFSMSIIIKLISIPLIINCILLIIDRKSIIKTKYLDIYVALNILNLLIFTGYLAWLLV